MNTDQLSNLLIFIIHKHTIRKKQKQQEQQQYMFHFIYMR
jgi:hypothetical protein